MSLWVASQKWTLFCVHYYSKLLMCIYINYIPLEAWVYCLQTATVNWCWDNISKEIFKKKTHLFQYLAHPPLWKKQESGKTWRHGFSFSCGCIRKQRQFKPPGNIENNHCNFEHCNKEPPGFVLYREADTYICLDTRKHNTMTFLVSVLQADSSVDLIYTGEKFMESFCVRVFCTFVTFKRNLLA